jgi:hypothetical protein
VTVLLLFVIVLLLLVIVGGMVWSAAVATSRNPPPQLRSRKSSAVAVSAAVESDPDAAAQTAAARASELLERGSAAIQRGDTRAGLVHNTEALSEAWNATRLTILEWREALEVPHSDGDSFRALVTVPLERLTEKVLDDDPRPPLFAMLIAAHSVRNVLATRLGAEPVKFSFPSTDKLSKLVAAESSVRRGADAIAHQIQTIRAALNAVAVSFGDFSEVVEGEPSAERAMHATEQLARAIHNALVAILVGLPILLWPGGPDSVGG